MKVFLNNIEILANLKIHYPDETSSIQKISIDFTGEYFPENVNKLEDVIDYVKIEGNIINIVKNNQFDIIEGLAQALIDDIFRNFEQFNEISIKITKHRVTKLAQNVSVELSEKRRKNKVILALGSNIGERGKNLTTAIKEITEKCNAKRLKTSSFMDFAAQIDKNSPKEWNIDFLNASISFETNINWEELFRITQEIQNNTNKGAKKSKSEPRVIDIDIIYFNGQIISTQSVQIPHKECYFRDFVLKPALEIEPEIVKIA